MSAALQPTPPPRPSAPRPDFPTLRLEDFSLRLPGGAPVVADPDALRHARLEGQAEGAAQARDHQLEALTEALRQHGTALQAATATHAHHAGECRAEIAGLLRAVAGALLPRGRDARLVEALVEAVADSGDAAALRAQIHCPARLHDRLRQACREAGLAPPALAAAPDAALHLDGGVVRIDLGAMQARLMQLIDAYATGES